jgi:hypothetical protein
MSIEAEEPTLSRAVTKHRLVKTLYAREDLACSNLQSVEISESYSYLYLRPVSGQYIYSPIHIPSIVTCNKHDNWCQKWLE